MHLGDLDVLLHRSDSSDDLLRADESREISVGQLVERNGPALLLLGRVGLEGSVDGIELLEGGLGPDDKTTEMSSGSQLEEVQAFYVQNVNSGNVTEGASAVGILSVDQHWTQLSLVELVSHLTSSRASALRSVHLKCEITYS